MLAGRRWLPFPGASDAKQQPGSSGLEAFRALGGAGARAPTWEQCGEMLWFWLRSLRAAVRWCWHSPLSLLKHHKWGASKD